MSLCRILLFDGSKFKYKASIHMFTQYGTRPAKINHVCKKSPVFWILFYHNLPSFHANKMGFLHTTFRAEDISKNITRCNLHLHGWFFQARSHSYVWYTLIALAVTSYVHVSTCTILMYDIWKFLILHSCTCYIHNAVGTYRVGPLCS